MDDPECFQKRPQKPCEVQYRNEVIKCRPEESQRELGGGGWNPRHWGVPPPGGSPAREGQQRVHPGICMLRNTLTGYSGCSKWHPEVCLFATLASAPISWTRSLPSYFLALEHFGRRPEGARMPSTPLRISLSGCQLQQGVLAPLPRGSAALGGPLGPLLGRFFSKCHRGGTRLLKEVNSGCRWHLPIGTVVGWWMVCGWFRDVARDRWIRLLDNIRQHQNNVAAAAAASPAAGAALREKS